MVIFLLKQDRLSDDESADNLDEMDGGEGESTLGRPEPMNEEQSDLPADENTTILPEDTRCAFVSAMYIQAVMRILQPNERSLFVIGSRHL